MVYLNSDVRVIKWNEDRGTCDAFDIELEKKLFLEEKQEFIDAMKEDSLIDMIDAWADMKFVLNGTYWKYKKLHTIEDKIVEDFINMADDFIDMAEDIIKDKIKVEYNTWVPLDDFFTNVCEANLQKSSKKDENGKIKKPEGFIPPEARHEETLIKRMMTNGVGYHYKMAGLPEHGAEIKKCPHCETGVVRTIATPTCVGFQCDNCDYHYKVDSYERRGE